MTLHVTYGDEKLKYPEVALADLEAPEKGSYKIGPFGSLLKKDELVEHGIPVVGIENVLHNQFLPIYRKYITEEKYKQLAKYTTLADDILVTTMGTIGRSAVVPKDVGTMIFDSHLFRMRVDTTKVYPQFLTYALNNYTALKNQIVQKSHGAIMAGLNTTILKQCTIPLPPLGEQKRIARILDVAAAVQSQRRATLTQLDALLQSTFLHMFGDPVTNPMRWPTFQLSDLCDLQNGFAFRSEDYIDYSNTLNCRMSNIRPDGRFDVDYNPKYLPDEYAQIYNNYRLNDGDVIIAMTDMANDPKILGVPTIVDTKGKTLLLNQRVGKLIFKNEVALSIPYLQFALNRKTAREYYKSFAGGGLQINIGKKQLLSIQLAIPPLEKQRQFDRLMQSATNFRNRLMSDQFRIDNLFTSLQQRAFRGELSPA